MIPRLFTPVDLAAGAIVELDSAAAHHALRVLRLGTGAAVELFDGSGHAATGTIASTTPGTVLIERLLTPLRASPLRLTLAQCISGADKMDWTIEKAVELGVTAIVPLQSQKAIVKLTAERSARRREHWQRLILAASAQSGQNLVPRLDEVMRLEDWLRRTPDAEPPEAGTILRLILDPRADESLPAVLAARESAHRAPSQAAQAAQASPPPPCAIEDVRLLCGSESGFSDAEFSQACATGWIPVGLGPRVLRTETAGLAALAVVQARWGDLR